MSASEKLRALGREVATKELGKPGVGELIDALPQIVTVVEAAELVAVTNNGDGGRAWPEIPRALAALDETLS